MTYLEIAFPYRTAPGERELRAVDSVREVYGIQRLRFDETAHAIRVTFDASRLKSESVARLLRQAGLDLEEKPVAVAP